MVGWLVVGDDILSKDKASSLDLFLDPARYLIWDKEIPTVCKRCGRPLSLRVTDKYVSRRCGCLCWIIYPINEQGVRVCTYILADEHEKDHKGREDG